MSSTVKWDLAGIEKIAGASQVIAANATTAFDFGTPDDIDLTDLVYNPGDRVLILISATRAAGTTSSLAFTIQDAPDSSGSIGTPATAVTSGTAPSFGAADTGHKSAVVALKIQPGRPWIRVNAVHGISGTDSFQCHCTVLGVASQV